MLQELQSIEILTGLVYNIKRRTQWSYEDAGKKPRIQGNHARQTADRAPHAETEVVGHNKIEKIEKAQKGSGVNISSAAKDKPPNG